MVFPPQARARTTCSYADQPANVLTVTVPRDSRAGEISRRGTEITVNEHLQRPRACAGGTPRCSTLTRSSCAYVGQPRTCDSPAARLPPERRLRPAALLRS